jgi:hypothetical protein
VRSTRLNWPRWWAAIGFLVIGPACLVGPYVAIKGGLATKPAVARWLGVAPRSAPFAVERERPLDPNQSTVKTYLVATRAMAQAVRTAVTLPLLPLAMVGLAAAWPPGRRARSWLFVTIILLSAPLALIRLHATGGYCSPRHAMVVALPLIAAAAFGLTCVLKAVTIPGSWLGLDEGRYRAGPVVWLLALAGLAAVHGSALVAPINSGFAGYRAAGAWLAEHVPPEQRVVDVTGWSLFYGRRSGSTFANLIESVADPATRWIVVREAHLHGPWTYCDQLRTLVAGLRPVAAFPEVSQPREAQVYIFDRLAKPEPTALRPPPPVRR